MRTEKVKLTKYVTVDLPGLPNFIIHKDGKYQDTIPVNLFSEKELRKIGRAWTMALIKRSKRK